MRHFLFSGCVWLVAGVVSCLAGDSGWTFKADFQNSLNALAPEGVVEPLYADGAKLCEGPEGNAGVQIPLKGHLIYEGAGNAFIPAGTVSFWWRPDAAIQKTEAQVLAISSFQRFYFSRWLHIVTKGGRLAVTLYHGDSAEVFEDSGAVPGAIQSGRKKNIRYEVISRRPLKEGEWVHVTVTWDMARGIAMYQNGELSGAVRLPWFYAGNVNHISLAARSSGYSKPNNATFPQSFAEVRVYDSWLEEKEVKQLAMGEQIVESGDLAPMLAERVKRLGLGRGLSLPETTSGETLWLKQIGMRDARDVLRKSRAAVDGDLGRAWPMYQGYSNSGEMLRVTLPPSTELNVIQTLGSGQMKVVAVGDDNNAESVLDWSGATSEVQGVVLPKKSPFSEFQVYRDSGVLFNLAAFLAEKKTFPAEETGWKFYPLGTGGKIDPMVRQEFAAYDRFSLTAGEANQKEAQLPAQKAIHLLGPEISKNTGLKAIALELAFLSEITKTDFCVMVVDPVNYERRAVVTNFRLLPEEGKNSLKLVLDVRDLVYPDGERPHIVLYAENALQVDLSQSRIGFEWASVEDAKKEFFPDLFALMNEDFQERSEGRPWAHDPKKIKGLGSLLIKVDFLRELEPDNTVVQGYYHWTRPRELTPEVKLPEVPAGVPEWAFYMNQAIQKIQQAAHWWIDNRQTPLGEFGAPDGINDDTDLIQDWLAIDLMNGPDLKIRKSVEKVADISWKLKTTDGISNQITDTLHIYEWGINAQTLAFVLNYGDPVYFERLLRFASHYPELMTETERGHLHFKSWYFGASRIVTEGIYGRDIPLNGLLLQPAMLLAWYNGDPESIDIVSRWTAAMREHIEEQAKKTNRIPGVSIEIPSEKVISETTIRATFADALWASYDQTGDESFRAFAGQVVDYELKRRPLENIHTGKAVLGAYLRETGDARWDAYWLESAGNPELWKRSLHNSNYKELEFFNAAWLRTKEDKWLDKGTKLTLYHLTWSLPMLTEAEATTDRVWLPQRLANHMTLGGLSILRNEIYPKHAVSWENATGNFAPLVRRYSKENLEIEIQNLEESSINVDARIWGLDAGVYDVHYKAASRETPEEFLLDEIKEQEIVRYSRVPLELPANSKLVLTFSLKKKMEDIRNRADLAISPLDAVYDPETKQLTCVIHNIGRKASGPLHVLAFNGETEIARQDFESLSEPKEFRTQKHTFAIPVSSPQAALRIQIVPDKNDVEITDFNNEITLVPEDLIQP